VVVVEHHVELLSVCDQLVELGPQGGAGGGRVIAHGTPAELSKDPQSITGPWLQEVATSPRSGATRKKVKQ